MARKKWTAEEMLEQVREVAAEVGPGLTLREFLDRGGVPESQIRRTFGTWEMLRRRAGLTPADRDRRRVSDEELFQEYFRLYRQLGRLPSARELDRLGRFAARTYYFRFGRRSDLKRALYDWLQKLNAVLEQSAANRAPGEEAPLPGGTHDNPFPGVDDEYDDDFWRRPWQQNGHDCRGRVYETTAPLLSGGNRNRAFPGVDDEHDDDFR